MRRTIFFLMAMMGSVLGLQGSARAELYLQLSDNAGLGDSTTSLLSTSGTLLTFSGTVGNFSVTLSAVTSTNAAGGSTLSINNLAVSLISGATLVAGGDKLTIDAAGTGFTLPVGSTLNLSNSGAATFNFSNSGDKMTDQGFVDVGNHAPPPFGQGVGAAASSVTSPGGTTGSLATPTTTATVPGNLGTYAASQIMTIAIVSTANQATESILSQASATITSVPEPSTMAIASLGALGLIGYGIRRRRGA